MVVEKNTEREAQDTNGGRVSMNEQSTQKNGRQGVTHQEGAESRQSIGHDNRWRRSDHARLAGGKIGEEPETAAWVLK